MGDTMEGEQKHEPGQWKFWRSKDGAWHWRQMSLLGTSRLSAAGYRQLCDCMANAMYHGYLPPSRQEGEALAAA
jgi:hypothetical protein